MLCPVWSFIFIYHQLSQINIYSRSHIQTTLASACHYATSHGAPHFLFARSSASGWKVWTSWRESIGTTSMRKTSAPRVVLCGSEFCGASGKAIAMAIAMAFFGGKFRGTPPNWSDLMVSYHFRRFSKGYPHILLWRFLNDEYCKTNGCERTLHWVTLMNIRVLLVEKSHRHLNLIEHTVIEQHRARKNWLRKPKAHPSLLDC